MEIQNQMINYQIQNQTYQMHQNLIQTLKMKKSKKHIQPVVKIAKVMKN